MPEIDGIARSPYGLFFLLRAMASSGRSGVIQLARGSRSAELSIPEGAVISAELRGLQGFPALHQLLLWSGADLSLKLPARFHGERSSRRREILDECERFLRDFAHAAQASSARRRRSYAAGGEGTHQPGVPEPGGAGRCASSTAPASWPR